MDLARQIAGSGGSDVQVLFGVVTDVSSLTGAVSVSIGGTTAKNVLSVTGYIPNRGDPVAVLRTGQQLLLLGGTGFPLPPVGVVTTVPVGSPTITVTAAGTAYPVRFLSTYTPVAADQVYIHWPGTDASGLVLGKVGTTAAPPAPTAPPPPPGAGSTGTTTFAATGVGTYRSGWRTDDNGDVIQGVAPGYAGNNEGAWFYSGHVRGTLAGATVTGAEIWLGRTSGGVFGSQTANLYRVTNDTRPTGALTFSGGSTGVGLAVGQSGWVSLPTSLAQSLVDSGGSIGIKGSPYMRLYGLSQSGSAGALRISWRR